MEIEGSEREREFDRNRDLRDTDVFKLFSVTKKLIGQIGD